MTSAVMTVFHYPTAPHIRRHGPQGYLDYKHYKPWLRDEFAFRCVYCLCRERWVPDGEAYYGIDHVVPRSRMADRISTYDDLVYACCVCNACKKDCSEVFAVDQFAFAEHLKVRDDGTIQALTSWGQTLIETCALDRPALVAFRRDVLTLIALLEKRRGADVARLRKRYLGYPDDLPDVAALRPLEGNSRSAGIAASHFERHRRGELPDTF